jgi:hypothetical protein
VISGISCRAGGFGAGNILISNKRKEKKGNKESMEAVKKVRGKIGDLYRGLASSLCETPGGMLRHGNKKVLKFRMPEDGYENLETLIGMRAYLSCRMEEMKRMVMAGDVKRLSNFSYPGLCMAAEAVLGRREAGFFIGGKVWERYCRIYAVNPGERKAVGKRGVKCCQEKYNWEFVNDPNWKRGDAWSDKMTRFTDVRIGFLDVWINELFDREYFLHVALQKRKEAKEKSRRVVQRLQEELKV